MYHFLNRTLHSRLDLLKPNCECTVGRRQSFQVQHHDEHKSRLVLQVKRYGKKGDKWVPGVILQRLGALT